MKQFIKQLEGRLTGLPVPTEPERFFEAVAEELSILRGRKCTILLAAFPREIGASGLWLDLGTRDVIAIEKGTRFSHQLVIFGHELGHMLAGDCGNHGAEGLEEFLTHMLGGSVPVRTAARTSFAESEERDAEKCGHQFKLAFSRFSEGDPSRGKMGDVGHRINATLGRRF
ncbi:toxin-antitoxin system, toxin component [Streptomyces sp. NPDC002812]|uniref:toxin-antitoxin system, toxin component n=1 Tax=Streptomyces sp. NPDC002812 TaxID=3154434 RepID=UPI00331689F9